MSISPTDAKGSASSPHSRSTPNPNIRHGPFPRRPAGAKAPETAASRSGNEGPEIVIAGGSYESASNLTELRTGVIEGFSHYPISGTSALDHILDGKDADSDRSDQKSAYPHSGRRAGGSRSLQPYHYASGTNQPSNVAQSGARKNQMVSANHLLNFHYDPIQRPQPRLALPRKAQKVRPFNRDLFLQANYRFVVLDTGNYFVELMNPDKMLDWDDIVCVSYSTPSPVQCPICLESPLCPQISSCGHIYCFPCILRYLLMGEEDHKGECWKKCPLCFMMISPKDLYTISISHVRQYEVGDDVKFSLLTRRKSSFVPYRKKIDQEEDISGSLDFFDSFSKFALTSDVEMSVREAKCSLNEWLARADAGLVDDLERLPYVCAALEHLEQRMKLWAERQSLYSSSSSIDLKGNERSMKMSLQTVPLSNKDHGKSCKNTVETLIHNERDARMDLCDALNGIDEHGSRNGDCISESVEKLSVSPSSPTEGKLLRSSDKGKDAVDGDEYVFYQVVDGQHIILHPLNMKCLLYHYKDYDLLPSEISGKILQLETVTQSEAVRRRFRFLSHFSLTTTFQLCEIDLREMLPPDAFSPCIEEIKKRERERKHTARKERQARALAEDSRTVVNPLPCYRQAFQNDTSFSLDDFEALGNSVVPSTSPPVAGDRKLFSDVTRLGFAAAHDSPSLRSDDALPLPTTMEAINHGPSMPTLSFASIISTTKPVEVPEPRSSGFGKKGKKPTRVLLSTAGGRRY